MKSLRPLVKNGDRAPSTNKGISLLTVATLGVIVTMWVYATSAAILPMYTRAAEGKYIAILRSAAEAGLDYATSELNSAINGNGVMNSSLDDGSWHTVPAANIPDSNATVAVKVAKLSPPSSSAIYWDKAVSTDWRVVTATAKYAGLKKAIRIVLAPIYTNNGGESFVPYFQYAAFAQTSLGLSGSAYTDSYTPVYNSATQTENGYISSGASKNVNKVGGNVGSNNSPAQKAAISLSGASYIMGSINVFSSAAKSGGYLVTGSGSPSVSNQIIVNGTGTVASTISGFGSGTGGQGTVGANYSTSIAAPYASPPYTSASPTIVNATNNAATALLNGVSNAGTPLSSAYSLAGALTAPSNEPVVNATITQSGSGGSATYTVTQRPGYVVNLGALNISSSNVYNIPPGDYEVTSLSVSGAGKLNLTQVNGSYGPVRFFVSGPTSGNAVSISGSGSVNNNSAAPQNFQIWYGGGQGITLSGAANMYALVYAPGAPVSVTGSGALYGAVVGYSVTASGAGGIHFDTNLGNQNYGAPGYGNIVQTLTRLQAVTWQEPRSNAEESSWVDANL